MTYDITAPDTLRQTIQLPASKSISNRALVICALAGGACALDNLSDCDDTDVMVAALRDMPPVIDIKAAGTAMRFTTALLSVTPGEHTVTGTERMKHRPIGILVNSLRTLGADISYVGEEGYPPLTVRGGTLGGGSLQIRGDVSSQYISALLMIGPAMRQGLTLQLVGDVISRPYIELTLGMMREFGAKAEWTAVDTIRVEPQPYKAVPYCVENDWTAASYWYEMMALTSDSDAVVRLTGLRDNSPQGDSVVRYIFSMLGVKTTFSSTDGALSTVTLTKTGRRLPRLKFDFSACPDLAQTVVCTCCGMGIPFDFTGLSTLKIKETDRIEALKTEMAKLGFVLRDIDGRELVWDGERREPTGEALDTYDDHRMAMAMAPLAFVERQVKINNPGVVSKSYPRFWQDLSLCGFSL